MGRNRTPPPAKKASAPAAAHAPPPTAKPAPPQQQHHQAASAPPPQHHAPPPMQQQMPMGGMPMQQSRGPGLMGMMGASMAGSLAGNALAHHMFGAPQPTSSEGVQEMKQVMDQSPCAPQFDMYAKCMEHNNNNADACSWAWDSVSQCRTKAVAQAQQGPSA